jgi:hypothetical protein
MASGFSVDTATQLAISLVNQPGTLAQVCGALSKADINIHALTVLETWSEHSVVRTVVSDPERAQRFLRDANLEALETEVLMIETDNQPGALGKIAERLSAAGINIEYAYLSAAAKAERGCIILRPSDVEKAQEILRDS